MGVGRADRAVFALSAVCAAASAWAAAGTLDSAAAAGAESGPGHAAAQPAKCDQACQDRRRQHQHELRLQNAGQKRPNVVVIDTDDMNVTDMFVMQKTLAL